ncbi:hypothetical protein [Paraburkholderia xenovorans]
MDLLLDPAVIVRLGSMRPFASKRTAARNVARKQAVFAITMVALLSQQTASAQALLAPVENLVINRAEAAIISRVAVSRGFAANDPRIAATLAGMSQVSTGLNVVSTGAAVGLGFAGAPVWLTVAAGLGILAAGSALYAGAVTLSRSADGATITAQQPVPALPTYTGPVYQATPPASGAMQNPFNYGASMGMQVYRTNACMANDSTCAVYPPLPATGLNFVRNAGSLALVAANLGMVQSLDFYEQRYYCNSGVVGDPPNVNACSGVQSVTLWWQANANGNSQTLMESRTISHVELNPDDSRRTVTETSNFPVTWWTAGKGVAPVLGNDLSSVYPQLTQASLDQPLDANTLALLTNQTWQQAAQQPWYQGLPYSASQPIGYEDVQPWVQANPTVVPNVGDLFRPASDPGTSIVNISPTVQPGSNPLPPISSSSPVATPGNDVNVVNTPNVNVINKVSVDLGTDPSVQSPSLEQTPTISMILEPVLNLLPDLKVWVVPAHSSACPQPSFTLLGRSYTMSAQCDLAEANRTTIYTAFAAMFTLAALLVVLRA